MGKNKYRIVILLVVLSLIQVCMSTSAYAGTKAKVRLSKQKVTLCVGDSTKIKLSGAKGKVTWKVKDKSIAAIKTKSKNTVTFVAKKKGTTYIIATYKGKKYKCKICVRRFNEDDDIDPKSQAIMDAFVKKYITAGMSEYQKMEKVAWYIEAFYDYDADIYDWTEMLSCGRGDCYASRFAVMHFCRNMGIKALACPNLNYHGETYVKADGKYYRVVTGFTGPKPRSYVIEEVTYDYINSIAADNDFDMKYFK